VTPAALRQWLLSLDQPVTYVTAQQALGFARMQDLTQALEILMEQDVAGGQPLLASMLVSRTHPMPGRGFFDKARALGYGIDDEATFHRDQLAALGKVSAKP
jgi:hypothetical protein